MRERLRVEAQRRLPHVAITCVVAGLALSPVGWVPVLVAACSAGAGGRWVFGRRGGAVALALVLIAAAGGALRIAAIDRPARAAPPGSALDAEATLLERPRVTRFGSSAPMRIETGPAHGLRVLGRSRDSRWPASDPGIRFHIHGFVKPATASSADPGGSTAAAPGSAAGALASGSGRPASASAAPSEANAGKPGTPGYGPLPARDPDPFDYDAFL